MYTLVVEAKYRTMCSLIENSGYCTCVDLPCGYTPKALHLTAKGIQFIGLDLPIVVQEMEPVMHSLTTYPERMAFHPVDATNYDSLDGARKRQSDTTNKEQPFAMHYTMENGLFRVSLCGRLDSITAPELLLEWEKEKVATNIEKVIVDFERLTYISSAGVRVLLTMQEKTKCGVTLIHVSPPVKKLLEQHENLSFAQ